MARIVLTPTSPLMKRLLQEAFQIEPSLKEGLQSLTALGVKKDDILVVPMDCTTQHTLVVGQHHVAVLVETDNPRVTAPQIASILGGWFGFPFEVKRHLLTSEDDWASNYDQHPRQKED